jgi:phosphoribosyl 1,2-cyclic phosphodiesterase
MFSVRFWGVRGTIPRPGASALIFGGNTSCIEIRAGKKLIIVDAGSGIKPLGDHLVEHDLKTGHIDADLFITHTHIDHILGMMTFTPAYIPSTCLRIYGPRQLVSGGIQAAIDNFNTYQFWPVDTKSLNADITYYDLTECTLDLGGGLKVTTKYLNHPAITLGYRFEYEGKSIVTAYDCEPFFNYFAADKNASDFSIKAGEAAAEKENAHFRDFISGADILVCDGQYTAAEYLSGKMYWGHSSIEADIQNAREASVKKLVVFHHDPSKNDEQLEADEKHYCNGNQKKPANFQMVYAREGLLLNVA